MGAPPPVEAEIAILGPVSELVHRVEIYESDGATRWEGGEQDDRLIDGSVTIDYARAERRAVDLVLDNEDFGLRYDPVGFWYDKILKVYSGVKYVNTTPVVTQLTRTNLWTNPSIETGTTGLTTATAVTASQSADWAANGTKSLKTVPNSTSNDCHVAITGDSGGMRAPLQAGKTYTVSATVYIPIALTGTLHPTRVGKIVFHHKIGAGAYVETQSNAPAATGATRLKVTFTIPPDATEAFIRLYNGATNSAVNAVYWDSIVIEEGVTNGLYFDGATPAFANRTYAWSGVANASTSIETTTITTQSAVNAIWETQIGEFMIDTISESHFPFTIKVVGRDYTKKCLLSKFVNATAFAAGSSIDSVIKAIAQNGGVTKFLFPLTGKTLDRDYFFERNTERWKAMTEIATAFGYELFFDAQGYLIMREFQDPVSAPLSYTFQTGEFGNMTDYTKSVNDTRIFNHIVVTGESTDSSTLPVMAEAMNTEPSSPTRIEKIGDRVYPYSSPFITTQVQAQDVADKLLRLMSLEEFNLDFGAIALPWLESGEIIEFIDPRAFAGQPTRYLLSSLTMPLGLGAMAANGKRISVVG